MITQYVPVMIKMSISTCGPYQSCLPKLQGKWIQMLVRISILAVRTLFIKKLAISATPTDFLNGTFVNAPTDFSALNYNILKAVYHGIRLDIGVISPNQIYNSPTRFNASISEVPHSAVNRLRAGRSEVGDINLSRSPYNQRVPKVLYLTSVFAPKPLGQAIAAVFVATFSMIAALWHIVNFIASSLVTARSKQGQYESPCWIVADILTPSFSNILSLSLMSRSRRNASSRPDAK